MALDEHLVELTAKRVIACRDCHEPAIVFLDSSPISMVCPGCHATLGHWETMTMAIADITAYTNR